MTGWQVVPPQVSFDLQHPAQWVEVMALCSGLYHTMVEQEAEPFRRAYFSLKTQRKMREEQGILLFVNINEPTKEPSSQGAVAYH